MLTSGGMDLQGGEVANSIEDTVVCEQSRLQL